MALIGAAIGAAASIAGGIASSLAAQKQKRAIENQRRRNKQWFDKAYNEDMTQRADALRLLTMTEESIKNRNKQAEARQAVTGGTDSSIAAAREANNEALANTMSSIAANNTARKDKIMQTYQQKDDNYAAQLGELEGQRAQSISQATGALTSLGGSLDFGTVKTKKKNEIDL